MNQKEKYDEIVYATNARIVPHKTKGADLANYVKSRITELDGLINPDKNIGVDYVYELTTMENRLRDGQSILSHKLI